MIFEVVQKLKLLDMNLDNLYLILHRSHKNENKLLLLEENRLNQLCVSC